MRSPRAARTTRSLTFKGTHLFVNATMAQGQVVTAPAVQAGVAPVIIAPPPPAQVVYSGYPYPYAAGYPVYPAYRPYYPPISLSFGYVYGGGHRHWR